MAVTTNARAGRPSAASALAQPIHTQPLDTKGLVDLDALNASGLNSRAHSDRLLASHRTHQRSEFAERLAMVSLPSTHGASS